MARNVDCPFPEIMHTFDYNNNEDNMKSENDISHRSAVDTVFSNHDTTNNNNNNNNKKQWHKQAI